MVLQTSWRTMKHRIGVAFTYATRWGLEPSVQRSIEQPILNVSVRILELLRARDRMQARHFQKA
jgi:hypothetical protein